MSTSEIVASASGIEAKVRAFIVTHFSTAMDAITAEVAKLEGEFTAEERELIASMHQEFGELRAAFARGEALI